MNMAPEKKSQELSPRAAIVAIVVFLLLAGGVIAGVVKLLTGSSGSAVQAASSRSTRAGTRNTPNTDAGVDGDFTIVTQRNLFAAPGSKPLIPAKADVVKGPAPFAPSQPVVPPPPPPAPPPKVAYTGSVEIAGTTYALLEDLDTHEAQYLRAGSNAFGCTLTAVNTNYVTVTAYGQTFTLNIGENKVEEAIAPPKVAAPAPPPSAAPAANQPPATPTGTPDTTTPNRGGFRGGRMRGGNGAGAAGTPGN